MFVNPNHNQYWNDGNLEKVIIRISPVIISHTSINQMVFLLINHACKNDLIFDCYDNRRKSMNRCDSRCLNVYPTGLPDL